ncbi:hypothetical protein SNE40_002665 [Patella caerulea]|uniref:Uncharacterized protein n=1 Tax=Patella caerulea TaxID=87958 RepID=A0AAN8Q3I4_PATCE
MAFKFWISGLLLMMIMNYNGGANVSGCQDVLDIVVVVDGSDSISENDFTKLKQAVIDLTKRLKIDKDYTRFGLVLYSATVSKMIKFSGDKSMLDSNIRGLIQPRDGTNTHLGLSAMIDMISKDGRKGVETIGIVITDGISKNKSETTRLANLAKNIGVDMYSVGVGSGKDLDESELKTIASKPEQSIISETFNSLSVTLTDLLPKICPDTTTTITTTTTTTTPRRTTTTVTPPTTTGESVTFIPDPSVCEGCLLRNGIGFLSHPTDCEKFFQCSEVGGTLTAHEMSCGTGLFWDIKTFGCNYPDAVNCTSDPCRNPGTTLYKVKDNCRQYRSCVDKSIIPLCCDKGYSFNDLSKSCQPDSSCTDMCLGEADSQLNTVCNKRSIAGNGSYFEEDIPEIGWMKRRCAPGAGFNPATCSCTDFLSVIEATTLTPVPNECKATLKLPFDKGVMDESGNGNWVENIGVVIENGEAYFNGNSGLRIPRFSNVALGSTFMIKMRYRTDGTVLGQQALVTNRDCDKPGSLSIILDQTTTTFGMRTDGGQITEVPVPVGTQSQWKVIEYKLENGVLMGQVDGNTKQMVTSDMIGRSECALQVGRGNTFSNFKGYIDYIEVYMC